VPDFVGWGDPITDDYSVIRWISVDYNGTSAQYLNSKGLSIPTSVTGSIKETQMTDGRAKVTITLHTENALTFAFTSNLSADWSKDPLDFGYRPRDLVKNQSLQPALGTSDLSITFYNPAIGSPIPDLTDLVNYHPDQIADLSFVSNSTGTFHAPSGFTEGTQGTVANHQKAVLFKTADSFNGNTSHPTDLYPQETITYTAN
jgi:hypothetical protein